MERQKQYDEYMEHQNYNLPKFYIPISVVVILSLIVIYDLVC